MHPTKKSIKSSAEKKPLIPPVVSVDASTLLLVCAAVLFVPLLLVGFISL
ncbi:MAG: hypothetical protein AAFX40_12795 [Cyanobacteria bacterium J06639_1]